MIAVSSGSNLGSGAITLNKNGLLQITKGISLNQAISLNGGGIDTEGNDITLSGALSGAGELLKSGAGILTITGRQNYTGGININQGVVAIDGYTASQNNLTVSIQPGPSGQFIASELKVNGIANLTGGTLTVTVTPSSSGGLRGVDDIYSIIKANSISGQFENVKMGGAYGHYLLLTPTYSGATVELQLGASAGAYNSGQFYAASFYAQNQALSTILAAPGSVSPASTTANGYWLQGLGNFGHARSITYNNKGFAIGRGFALTPNLVVGGAISNVYTNTNGVNGSSVSGVNFGAELNSIYTLPRWRISTSVGVGHLGNSATRELSGIGQGKFATNGMYQGMSMDVQYKGFAGKYLFVSPYAQASYWHTHMGDGQETGLSGVIPMNMRYGAVSTNLGQVGAGVTADYNIPTTDGLLMPWVRLGGLATLGNTHNHLAETVGQDTSSASAQVAATGAFTSGVGVQLTGGKTSNWQLGINWNGQFAKNANAQSFALQGTYKW